MFVNCVTAPGTPLTPNEHLGDTTLNRQGHDLSFKQVPKEVFAGFFPGAGEVAEMFSYFQAHTYLGSIRMTKLRSQTKWQASANTVFGVGPGKFPGPKNAQSAAR